MSTSTCSDGRDHWTSRPRGRGAVQAVVACAVRSRCIVLPKVGREMFAVLTHVPCERAAKHNSALSSLVVSARRALQL